MKVKVSKTCEINEVSSIVINTLVSVQGQLSALSNHKFNYWQVGELLSQIDLLRNSLSNIDSDLDDASSIASGWLEAVLREAQGAPDTPEPTDNEQEEIGDEKKEEI